MLMNLDEIRDERDIRQDLRSSYRFPAELRPLEHPPVGIEEPPGEQSRIGVCYLSLGNPGFCPFRMAFSVKSDPGI